MALTNFNYVKSFDLMNGGLYTLALDALGQLWTENVVTAPTIMTPLVPLVEPTTFMFSTTQADFEYMCFSNLLHGTDIPRQYNPQPSVANDLGYTLDRISQVGPGAPPTFQTTGATASGQAHITSWAAAGGIVTFQAVNAFTAGEVINLTAFVVSTFFNGLSLEVLGTGLSGTQFEVAFSGTSGGSDSGTATPQFGYPIQGITQAASTQFNGQIALWSSGPGQTSSGTTITLYYGSKNSSPDPTLTNAFNSGRPVYVYVTGAPFGNGTQLVTGIGAGAPPGEAPTVNYFTFQAPSANYQKVGGPNTTGNNGTFDVTAATLIVITPIPGVNISDEITISGASPSGWNAVWTITSTNVGNYNITQTSMTSGVATYNWVWSGSGPAVKPASNTLVTVIQTLNGNGIFNVTNAPISNVTGGPSSGTFDISGFALQNIAQAAETGQASTAGTVFTFDPGQVTYQTSTNPIFGNAAANTGVVTIAGSNTAIGAGTRQAVCFFETRNGLKTMCSAPITFTTDVAATYIVASNIPIGPPNVIRRWIAFTGAGPNGIPGPNFYTIDTPVSYTVNNQTFRYSATYIDDNVTTSAKFTFTDAVLLAGEEIDVQGNNLFSLIELGSVGWNIAYASRMFYGLEQSKVLNFTNLSFDGGFIPNTSGNVTPLGWGVDPGSNITSGTAATITAFQITGNVVTFTAANSFLVDQQVVISGLTTGTYLNGFTVTVLSTGLSSSQFEANFTHTDVGHTVDSGAATPLSLGATLLESPIFGNSYYISNQLGATETTLGMIIQSAYQDAYNVPIIQPNVQYSVRVTARIPSGLTTGTLVVDLTDSNPGLISGSGTLSGYGTTYGSFQLPFSSMTTTMTIYTGTLLVTPFTTGVPAGLFLRLFAQNIGYGADVEIDRIEVYPTKLPTLTTNVRVSYINRFEQFDGLTGNIGLAAHNTQTAYGAFELHDQLYFLQTASMQSTQDVPGTEPSGPGGGWGIHEVSNRVGTCGIHAYDYGEEWVLTACRNGVFGFNGGQPIRLDFQQKEIWNVLNWTYGYTIWLKNDLNNRRFLVGVPLPTPNQWLPLAAVNSNPTSPNVILMWNYQGLNDFNELVSGQAMHTTMFGNLVSTDMRLKMSIWQIQSPYAGLITQSDLTTQEVTICNGTASGKIYRLSDDQLSDDGVAIFSKYWTYGFVDATKAVQNPLLGMHRKRFQEVQQLVTGSGTVQVQAWPNFILTKSTLTFNPQVYTSTGGIPLVENPPDDIVRPLNVAGNRVFMSYSTNAVGAAFNLSKMIMVGTMDPYASVNPNAG